MRPDEVEAALYAETALARERIRAEQREASERRHKEWLAGVLARHQRVRETGESYDALLAADMKAGGERIQAWAEERKRQTRQFQRQSVLATRSRRLQAPACRPARQQGTSRERRTTRRVAGAARSRDRPRKSDDDEPADDVTRPPLTRAERDYLRVEVDRLVRQGLADQQVADKALFRSIEAWGEAGVVA
jgi:hypothetical protein